jgi:uncharacterized protein (TIGR03546 family)
MLRAAAKLLRAMNSETEPGQISLALCFAMVAGLTPLLSLHNLFVLLLVLVLRVNVSAFLVGLGVFSALAYPLDPLFHRVGLSVLRAGPLQGLWTSLYNSAPWRLERFYNTVTMGSLLVSLVLFIPLFLATNLAIRRYREHVMRWVERSRAMTFFKGTRFYRLYKSVSGAREYLR